MTGLADAETHRSELTLLGTPGLLVRNDTAGGGIGPGKSLALLAYLAVRRQVRRDELISLLWGDMPEDQARNAFRQALHRIRKSVGSDILQSDRDALAIGPPNVVQVDRDVFLAACDQERWAEATALYTGDFLEGFEVDEPAFDRWANAERMQLRGRFQSALKLSGEAALRNGDVGTAVQQASRLVASAPFEPDAALFQANVLVAAGKTADAISALRQFVVRLQTELDLDPPAAVQTLIARLERNAEGQAASLSGLGPPERRVVPLVGRDAEIARLLAGVVAARSEHGSTLVIEGESGMGRTRLLDELRSRLRDLGGVLVLRGRERATTSVVPYAAIAEALRPLARAPGVAGASRHLLAEAARLLPELRDSFDLPDVGPVEDAAGRLRFFEGVAATIDAAAYEQPLCILLDDVHHASAPSLDLLAYLSGRLRASPVTFVLTARSDRSALAERLRAMAQSSDDASDSIIALTPLSVDETRALVEQIVPEADRQRVDVDRVARLARGRPALAIDLAKRAAAGESPSEAPALLRDILWGRLQASSPSQRRVFFAAALLERAAPIRLLAAAAHLPENATLEAARDLSQSGLLRDEGAGYVVAHDSTLSFVAEASGIAGRALLAGWAADALAAEAAASDAELANLYATAGRPLLAFTHSRAAAFSAAALGATAEATHHLTVALAFAPDDASRTQIEGLLAAFGAGSPRLVAPGSDASDASDASPRPGELKNVADDADVSIDEGPTSPSAAESRATQSSPIAPNVAIEVPWTRRASVHQWYMSIALSAIVILLGILARRQIGQLRPRAAASDSVVIERRDPSTTDASSFAVSASDSRRTLAPHLRESFDGIAWLARLSAPWVDPIASPDRSRVALAQVTAHGKDLYVVSADLRDTIPIALGGGDNVALAWSPDSRTLLVSRSRTLGDGSYDSDLYAIAATRGAAPVAIDTSSTRSIAEASWSPTGVDVAWVARVGPARQRDVFVAHPDGSNVRNITSSPAEDFDVAWSPDGSLLAFASTRSGGPRIYTYDFANEKLWAVSDRDGENRPRFSPDGRLLAFETTRDGVAGVYVRPALGGRARRISPTGGSYTLAGWANVAPSWIERARIVGATTMTLGDTIDLNLLSVGANGAAVSGISPVWRIDDRASAAIGARVDRSSGTLHVVARREGTEQIVASIPGWRTDTVTITVASAGQRLVEDFADGLAPTRWLSVGSPAPRVGASPLDPSRHALFPNAGMEWDSGLLSKLTFQLTSGASLTARVIAPFVGPASPASFTIGFVPAGATLDLRAPQPQPTVGVSWDGQSGALRYTAAQESFSDLDAARTNGSSHEIAIRLTTDGTVVFSIDGRERWRSPVRFTAEVGRSRAQLWLGGHATGTSVAFTSIAVESGATVR